MIDLRSDTVTRPTPAMRKAMYEAEVGDSVYGEDPTVRALEERTAEILGKEAALFMPSGTMSNQVAVRCQTEPGDEIIMDYKTHVHYYEVGAAAALSGVSCRMIHGKRGIFSAAALESAIRPLNIHYPVAKLVCIENTHNKGGGAIWPLTTITAVERLARKHRLRMHMDGARLWHAAVASGHPERDYANHFDTVSVCFSKGLGAPIGSALAGDQDTMLRAERFRKQFGGGMRQAGIVAAGALYALEHQRERLAEDHANARALAEGLASLPGIELDPHLVETNVVNFRVLHRPAPQLYEDLKRQGILVFATSQDTIRAVTHCDVSRHDIETVLSVLARSVT
ncbi:threonine aldolase family protein [Methylotetracoccus oryzae]|uniref:threonine aldolase family protein n=1 Tax=Methylotetracoccus oryzae TaxID=1919059 RepID=UPI00111A3EAF|nr:GntG family PLP-dependent aldolase [Methylotetracoccus oryzae]